MVLGNGSAWVRAMRVVAWCGAVVGVVGGVAAAWAQSPPTKSWLFARFPSLPQPYPELGYDLQIAGDTLAATNNRTPLAPASVSGWVRRDVVVEGGATWVVNTGGGDGFNPMDLNDVLAPIVWGGRNPVRGGPASDCLCQR